VEVNSETDFVARNEKFQDMVRKVAAGAAKANGDLGKLLDTPFPGSALSVEDYVKDMVATIGENMSVRRTASLSVAQGAVADYVHNKAADGLGKIGVLVGLESKAEPKAVAALGRQLAMHIAAASPAAVTAEELDPALIARERAIYTEQATASGKSADIVGKMVEGRLRKEFYQQAFLGAGGDGKQTVAQVLEEATKRLGAPVKVHSFVRYALGEGIDKKDDDFAAEVARAAGR
jgi:elongation factor Ts